MTRIPASCIVRGTFTPPVEWFIAHKRKIAFGDPEEPTIILFGSEKEYEYLQAIVDAHNSNIILGITDSEYNASINP